MAWALLAALLSGSSRGLLGAGAAWAPGASWARAAAQHARRPAGRPRLRMPAVDFLISNAIGAAALGAWPGSDNLS